MKNLYKAIALALAITGATGATATFADVNQTDAVVESRAAAVQSGWYYNGHVWRYFKDGTVQTGWIKDSGKWYFLSYDDGAMVTYPTEIGGSIYVFRADGSLVESGWSYALNQWYYVNADTNTAARNELKVVDGLRYCFDNDGVMQVGPNWAGGNYSLFGESGARVEWGWSNFRGTWYYSNHGFLKTDEWLYDGGNWYYLDGNGRMLANTYYHDYRDGKTYVFNNSGAMLKNGWQKVGGYWYYLNSDGSAKKGWLLNGGKWYYLGSDGRMYANTTANIGGTLYFFDSTGAMH